MNYLIDASIYIFQYYFSLPDHWYSKDGYPTAAVYGYTTFLLRFLEKEVLNENGQARKTNLALCFDQSLGSCFRNEIYPDYKSSRALPDQDLAFQLDACRQVSELLGFACFSSESHEADDFIGSLAKKMRRSAHPIAILTRDKDLGQLLHRPQDYLWDYAKEQKYFADDIVAKFGVRPQQMADYLAVVGDSIDDIPGVPGLGPLTAKVLFERFSSIKELFSQLEKTETLFDELPVRGNKKLREKLLAHREQILMSQQLSTIIQNLPLNIRLTDLQWKPAKVKLDALSLFCESMGFSRLNARINKLF